MKRDFFLDLFTVYFDIFEHFHHIHSILLQYDPLIDFLAYIEEYWRSKYLDSSHQNVEFIPVFWILFNFICKNEEKVFKKVKFWVSIDYAKPPLSNFGNIFNII